MDTMELSLKAYVDRCRSVFREQHSKSSNVVRLMRAKQPLISVDPFFEKTLKEVEQTDEFEAFVKSLGTGPLAEDLQRLEAMQERKRREKSKTKRKKETKHFDIEKWSYNTARHAAKSFFRNTGAYLKLWKGHVLDESNLLDILANYEGNSSESIRLFVFDGFVPSHEKTSLNSISLHAGELKKYTEKELGDLLLLPQTHWHYGVSPEIAKKAAMWHILAVREKSEYRGMTGLWLNGVLITPIDWDIALPSRDAEDVELIGPLFLWFGEDANLAVEIRIRTNVFEYSPVHQRERSGYLPWDSYDDEGNEIPRRYVKESGENGIKLRKVFDIWAKINKLDKDGFLRYPTETYLRTVMNFNSQKESLMEVFVGFITVIESLLTPESPQELAYKTSLRGAAILTRDSGRRFRLSQELTELYKTRSKIVHEGHAGKNDSTYYLRNTISVRLTQISRQIFLRYICLLYLGVQGMLPGWVLPNRKSLTSRNSRSKTIAGILDSVVLDSSLTGLLEEKMEEWDLYEDWIRKTDLQFKF